MSPANTSTATSLSLNISRLAFKSSTFPTCCYKVFSIDLAQPHLSVRLFADYSVERAAMDNKGTVYCLALCLLIMLTTIYTDNCDGSRVLNDSRRQYHPAIRYVIPSLQLLYSSLTSSGFDFELIMAAMDNSTLDSKNLSEQLLVDAFRHLTR
jgi:hypothetical protein